LPNLFVSELKGARFKKDDDDDEDEDDAVDVVVFVEDDVLFKILI
jgi:hypothetical protein